jgi:Protein of unknown function (DUF3142)
MLGLFRKRRGALRLLVAAAGVVAASLVGSAWRWAHAPRVWRAEEVAVAFWAWHAETPRQADVDRAARETGARTLFLRAGQLDFAAGRVSRVREVRGRMPRGVELHLVYNATPALLAEFERVDERELAAVAAETFRRDCERAASEGDGGREEDDGERVGLERAGHKDEGDAHEDEGIAHEDEGDAHEGVGVGHDEESRGVARVVGLQLDLDVPTRLLARYARVLRETRALLPTGARLSVTGLQTWMGAGDLRGVLEAVDFWSPQLYGAEIPATAERAVPISSLESVALSVARARELGKPFYAGLAAYGYALLYSEKGKLLEARGDIAPARIASDRNFELVERRAFASDAGADGGRRDAPLASEWRYVFRARGDAVVDGLVVRAGEQIVLDVPSSEHLRASVRGVREGAGATLLGICLFRLPAGDDPTTLSLAEVSAALRDREAETLTHVRVEPARVAEGVGDMHGQLLLTAENAGACGALFGEGALSLTLRVPRGSVSGVTRLEGFDSFETLCERQAALRPCSAARADFIRLGARAWPEGATARAGLSFAGDLPDALTASVVVRRDDGRVWERVEGLDVKEAEGR